MTETELKFIRWANDYCPHPDMERACRNAFKAGRESMREEAIKVCDNDAFVDEWKGMAKAKTYIKELP